MLQSLHIKDFILIERLDLDFDEGFCVITGDTGAGKSILLDTILFCFGRKISGSPVRHEADSCSVTTIFPASNLAKEYLEEVDIDIDEQIIIKRTQNKQGRSKFFVNDQIVTASLLQKLFDYLLELHGQHNHTLLIDTSTHIEILDEYGKLSLLRSEVSSCYKNWQDLERELNEFAKERANIEQEIEYLRHICLELAEARIEIGEEEKLSDIKKHLQNRDKEISLIESVLTEIESSSTQKIIAKSQAAISKLDGLAQLEQVNADLELAYDKIEDVKSVLNEILRGFDASNYSPEEVDDRLYAIRTLARKHSCKPDELINFLSKSEEQLVQLESKLSDSSNLQEQAILYKKLYFDKTKLLRAKRLEVAKELEIKTTEELSALEMQKAIFKVEVDSPENYVTSKGVDRVRFVASTNPGMLPAPIDKIASGGELSRFMLALRVALFDNAPKQTIIFDEIDVGISGFVADAMGERLKLLSKAVQIIVITHQPQIAGKANQHILVEKTQHDLHTSVQVRSLAIDEKALELARMISGKKITKTGIQAAKELIVG